MSPRPQVATVTGWGRTGVETTAPMSRALLVTQVCSDAVVSLRLLGHVNNQLNGVLFRWIFKLGRVLKDVMLYLHSYLI